ncbi:MAG: hypothetical protein GY783_19020 [Gammaproteobacteria bacterium]|nr:hypothetical protein [Gammaproteobacteria bacterium]
MIARISSISESKLHKIQQVVKWIVYTLLIINWGFYIYEDWDRAVHTLNDGSTLFDWAREFATSIDESAWFVLLFMFELQTYVLEDQDWKGWVAKTVHGVRLVCFAMIMHTVYAFAVTVIDYQPTVMVENVSDLCDMTNDEVSYVYNLEYTEITEQTCSSLSDEIQFYRVGNDPVVSTIAGLNLERDLAWADLVEVVTWLLILLSIEFVVRLQEHGVTGGTSISVANMLKIFLYLILFALAVYWASLSHWLYTWDTFVWIAGFAAIELNISDWRGELLEEQHETVTAGATT